METLIYTQLMTGKEKQKITAKHLTKEARWSSGINAANGARGPRFASRILPTVQVVNFSLSVAYTSACPAASG